MKSDLCIAVDVDSGDITQKSILTSCYDFLKNSDTTVILCGDESIIQHEISSWGKYSGRVEVCHADEVVTMDMEPSYALRRVKKSSMHHALNMVKMGKAQAAVSAGNTGALVALSSFHLGFFQSVRRPAICTQLPSAKGPFLMLDLGACVDCTPEDLLIFAILGQQMARALSYKGDSCALLNVGHEEIKGSKLVKEASSLMKAHLDTFTGNIEPTTLFDRPADVVVTDGFSGNLVLKSIESSMGYVQKLIRRAVTSSALLMAISPILKGRLKKQFDQESDRRNTNLPLAMVPEMRERFPDAKWYIIVDDDTFLFPQSIIRFLADRDDYHNPRLLLGKCVGLPQEAGRMSFGFICGGGGIVISRATMKKLMPHIPICREEFNDYPYGDAKLGACVWKYLAKQNKTKTYLSSCSFSSSSAFSSSRQSTS